MIIILSYLILFYYIYKVLCSAHSPPHYQEAWCFFCHVSCQYLSISCLCFGELRWVGQLLCLKNSSGSVTVFIQAQMLIVSFPFVGDAKQSRRWWFWPTVFSVWNVNGPASPPHWWFWETSAVMVFNQLRPLLELQFIDTIFLNSLFSLLLEMSSLYASWRFFFHLY